MDRERCPVPPVLVLAVGIVAISFSAILVKWSEAPAAVMGMYRLVFTVVLMIPFAFKYSSEIRSLTRRDWVLLLFSGFFLGLHFLFWIGSLKYTTVASSTVLLTLQPIFVMIGAYLVFGERTSALSLASLAIAVLGTVLIGWGDLGTSGTALLGDVLSILGTVAVSVYMLIGQTLRKRMSSLPYSFLVFVMAAFVLAVYNILAGNAFIGYAFKDWGIFVLMAVVPTIFGHALFNWLLKYVNAASISMSILGEPVGATILAYILLGEAITGFQLAGGCLAILGVWMFLTGNTSVSSSETRVQ